MSRTEHFSRKMLINLSLAIFRPCQNANLFTLTMAKERGKLKRQSWKKVFTNFGGSLNLHQIK